MEMKVGKADCARKANSITHIEYDGFDSCLDAIEYYFQTWHNDWLAQLFVFKDCPEKIKDFFRVTVNKEISESQSNIDDLKSQLKGEQKQLRKANKLKGVLGL